MMLGSRDTVRLTKRWAWLIQGLRTSNNRERSGTDRRWHPWYVITSVVRRPQRKGGGEWRKRRIEEVELRRAVRWIRVLFKVQRVRVSNKGYLPSLIDAVNQTLHRSPRSWQSLLWAVAGELNIDVILGYGYQAADRTQ